MALEDQMDKAKILSLLISYLSYIKNRNNYYWHRSIGFMAESKTNKTIYSTENDRA